MDHSFRFGGIQRLYGASQFQKIMRSHVCIVGIGGVGSWSAEALARSGLGKLTLIDYDDICESNINRQIHSLDNSIGQQKIDAMKSRLSLINPEIEIQLLHERFESETAESLMSHGYDVVIDATDQLEHKCFMINYCKQKGISLVTVGGSAGKQNPSLVALNDLAFTKGDRLLHKTRKKLRQDFGFPRDLKKPFGISCVYSSEEPHYPDGSGEVTTDPEARPTRPLDCSTGMGSASFVTGTFGFTAAYEAVRLIAEKN